MGRVEEGGTGPDHLRTLLEVFGNPFLVSELRFGGGTALNKLLFPERLRNS